MTTPEVGRFTYISHHVGDIIVTTPFCFIHEHNFALERRRVFYEFDAMIKKLEKNVTAATIS